MKRLLVAKSLQPSVLKWLCGFPAPVGALLACAASLALEWKPLLDPAVAGSAMKANESAGTFAKPFPLAVWLYQPIPPNPKLDPNSQMIVRTLSAGAHVALLHEFAIPFYKAGSATPLRKVSCKESWGVCTLEHFSPRPLEPSMLPHIGSDGAMVVIDDSPLRGDRLGRSIDEYWQYNWNDGMPTTSWGGISDLDGDGLNVNSTGAGISRAAGVIREFEVRQGKIEHALVFSTSYCAASSFRYPATKTDGLYTGLGAIPEGARIQLNPDLNPDNYRLTPGERIIFVALQVYGAYAIDCGGAAAAFSFEEIPGEPGATYMEAGFQWDYYGLEQIPWDQIQVLASWNGQ